MKKIARFGVVFGLLAGAGAASFVPAVNAQDAEPGPASELMESFDISIQGNAGGAPPPPMIGFGPMSFPPPGLGEDAPPPPPLEAMGAPDPDEMMARGGGSDMMMLRAGVQSSFSDDQLEKMYKIKTDFMDKAGPKGMELKSQERALRDLLTQPEFDKSKAQALQGKINTLRDDLANLKLEQRMDLLNTLTSEQRKELRRSYVKFMDFGPGPGMMKMRHGHGSRFGHHGGGPGSCGPQGGGPGGGAAPPPAPEKG
ncbi:MAG: periplasmic heavy metal sensor [Candidatus Obscuribacterales bacterium]|nr:periplasmic heavy metal sensor [Candidatus Obscuribacterales bacterium]